VAIIGKTPASQNPTELPDLPKWQKTRLEVDKRGYLYDAHFREMLARWKPGRSVLDIETMRALVVAGKVLYQGFEDALEEAGISHQQYRTMMWINGSGPGGTQLHEIASWLGVSPRNVTGLVDALEANGLVERVPDPSDRRAVIARLTPSGTALADRARAIHERVQKEIFGRITEEEKLQLRHISLKLIDAAHSYCGKGRANVG
jgi:DNA-binding MarR family transcriptional regulator